MTLAPETTPREATAETAPLLEARNLFKVFGRAPTDAVQRLRRGQTRAGVADAGTAAVIDASFSVQRGEIFVIMGPSASPAPSPRASTSC